MASPLSILHVDLSNDFGGTERYCADLATRQAENGHRVGLVARRQRRGQKDAVQDHMPASASVYLADRGFARFAITRAVQEQSVDIINAHLGSSARAVAAVRDRPPAVMTLHVRYKAKEARGMAGLVCVADWQTADLERFPGSVVVAHNWPPAPRPVTEAQAQALRRRLGANPNAVVVGFVGRLEPVKGVDRLIQAYRTWATPETRLAIIGDGRERARLTALAAGDPTIHFLGHVSPVDAWYEAMDLLVLPSDWEGLPLVALEAMHTGTPILASACAGTSEVLAGSPAVLIPPGQGSLTEALGALMARGERGELLRLEYDLSKFCPNQSSARIEAFYRDIIQAQTAATSVASATRWPFGRPDPR